jgi:hypothetical protein
MDAWVLVLLTLAGVTCLIVVAALLERQKRK